MHIAPLILHHAHPAGAVDGQLGVVAEGGHINAGLAHQLQNILFALDGDRDLVDEHIIVVQHGIIPP